MAHLNKIMLIGNVGRCETRTFESGKLTTATLCVSERYTRRDGTVAEESSWFDLVINGKLAEIAEKYVTKGTQLYVEGRMRQRSYTAKDGENRKVWEVVVASFQLLSPKKADGEAPSATAADNPDDLPF